MADEERTAARAILWLRGDTGVEPGSFEKLLVQTVAHADMENTARLALGFPSHVALMASDSTDLERRAAWDAA